ncbi:HSF-type DNA-binding-domain-containing protein [Suillus bovinus]|uniref:HSF-type DNA-binding-domain-containing protein n=1 Tax=Suillus bovinus TaxID=48563 RepID=UPI001B8713C0|nr:HSF-type DNA-binding-domain-containing protein [Suillus bovinus]KAG2135188.1 HSF-type DNA-binding-domain-containing protein [Suillus bovinus]
MNSSPYRHPSPVSWGPSSSSIHRTSNSREDVSIHTQREMRQMKREPTHQIHSVPPLKEQEDTMPATSDFVKKLYKMLEDHTFSHVVSWGPQGDCFVVKDMNEFTKSILPRMFKHSNFASFVRQLNKYDFHKVKTSDDAQFGEHSWTFRHPDFHADRRDALENIKRKVPAARKSLPSSSNGGLSGGRGASSGSPNDNLFATNESLRNQIGRAEERIRVLERQYGDVLVEMVNFQKGMAQQDSLMQGLIQYFLGEGGKPKDPSDATSQTAAGSSTTASAPLAPASVSQSTVSQPPPQTPIHSEQFVPAQELGLQDPDMVARLSLVQMNEMSRRAASDAEFTTPTSMPRSGSGASGSSAGEEMHMQRTSGTHLHRGGQHQQQQQSSSQASTHDGNATFLLPPDMNWDAPTTMHEGLQVFTVGHLLPRSSAEDQNGNWVFNANPSAGAVAPPAEGEKVVRPTLSNGRSSTAPTTIRVRRSTFVPGWAVPPRVLLVDDDAVSRRLSSKFLQVFGCMIDVAVDGVGAVNKMNLEKYDLVLMDIVMPKMDGVSATNLIRQFDHMTPIISMTSNSKPSEIMTYYSSGMNDILPKPFTKEGLLDMLEKHLMHLKVIQQMSKIPRSLGVPPLSDPSFSEALAVGASQLQRHASSSNPSSSSNSSSSSSVHAMGMSGYDDDGRINPLAGMGLSDERYAAILRDIVTQESFSGVGVPEGFSFGLAGALGPEMGGGKRGLDDESDGREGKRGRFEIIE